MSKLFKSKFLLGVLVVATVLVGYAVVSTDTAAAADCTISTTLRVGSVGADVQCLQSKLGVSADGKFGPMTKAAVVAWQASKGLVADGVVGPVSRAALMGTPVVTLPAGCQAGWAFNPATGASCSTGGSSSTGTGSLQGGAGSITVTPKSTYSSEDVVAGDEDVKVLAFQVEADDGSDVEITSVKVELAQTVSSNSRRIKDYLDSVSIFMGSEKVGEADAEDFSESNKIYTKTISLDDAVIDAGDKVVFAVAVSALENLDSGDIDNDAWTVDVLNVRFEDAEGVVTTEDTDSDALDRTFDVDDLSSSGDLELKVSKDSSSPEAQVVEVDDDNDTNDVLMLAAKLKATGSDMTLDNIEFNIYPVGAAENEIVKTWRLEVDGDELDSIDAGTTADGATGTIEFTDLDDDFVIEEDDTVVVKVYADINDLSVAFVSGDSMKVSFESTANVKDTTKTVVEDSNGDTVAAGDRTGSAVGETQTFYADGISVELVSVDADITTSADPATSGSADTGTFVIKFKVTAFGDDIYVDKDGVEDTAAPYDTATQVSYSMLNTANVAASSASLQSTADLKTNSYLVEEGTTETFTLTVAGAATASTFTNVKLEGIGYKVGSDAAGDTIYSSDLKDFKTGDLYLTVIP